MGLFESNESGICTTMKLSAELLAIDAVSRFDMRRIGVSIGGEEAKLVGKTGPITKSSENSEEAGLSS